MKAFTLLLLLLFTLFSKPNIYAADTIGDEQIRRLYLDLIERLPNEYEYLQAKEFIKDKKYTELADKLVKSYEFRQHLSRRLIQHYKPKSQNRGGIQNIRLEEHITENYTGKKDDLRRFINDTITAKGISYSNPLTAFFTRSESPPDIASRVSERYLGLPYNCARCHDSKDYDEIKQSHFWELAAYFNGVKKAFVRQDRQLKMVERGLANADSGAFGKDVKKIEAWLNAEKNDEYIYKSGIGAAMGKIAKKRRAKEEEKNKKKDPKKVNEMKKRLLAPQMVVWEKKHPLEKVRIRYKVEGKVHTAFAKLPFVGAVKGTERPRDVLAKWMINDDNPYTKKTAVNWVSRWLYGHSYIEPVNDVHGGEGYKKKSLKRYTEYLEDNDYKITSLVRKMINSKSYKQSSTIKNNDEKFMRFKERKLRHLTGEQILNTLSYHQNDGKVDANSNKKMREMRNNARTLQQLFPVALDDSEAYYKGSISRSLFMANNRAMLNFVNKKAKEAHKRANSKERYTEKKYLLHLYRSLLTREPTSKELSYLMRKMKSKQNYQKSSYFEVTWSILNSPEMRLY